MNVEDWKSFLSFLLILTISTAAFVIAHHSITKAETILCNTLVVAALTPLVRSPHYLLFESIRFLRKAVLDGSLSLRVSRKVATTNTSANTGIASFALAETTAIQLQALAADAVASNNAVR